MGIISFIATFLCGVTFMLLILCITAMAKDKEPNDKEPSNHVHFYVARDKNGELFLYMSKPFRGILRFNHYQNGCIIASDSYFSNFGLNEHDYDNLKWEDEPVEVFLNLKD